MTNASASPLDPVVLSKRVLACSSCFEPVMTSAWEGAVSTRCARCGTEGVRRVTLDPLQGAAEHPYRGSARPEETAPALITEVPPLEKVPPGLVRHVKGEGFEDWKRAVSRAPRDGEPAEDAAWERVWLACWLSASLATASDHVRARMVLETTLETATLPAHRALLLTRLAQHAAGLGAPRLARKWLRACPRARSASIGREKALARALIALGKGKHVEACALTGDRVPGKGFTGANAGLALAIHMEAMERRERFDDASEILRTVAAFKLVDAFAAPMHAYGLGRTTRERVSRSAGRAQRIVCALTVALVVGFFGVTCATLLGTVLGALGAAAVEALLVTLTGAIPWARWLRQPWRERMYLATLVVLTVACVFVAAYAMPRRERPYALVRAETSASASVTDPGLQAPPLEAPQPEDEKLAPQIDIKTTEE